jgi:8-oxo-dGTP pyrophosphatase MutT (NUDIX family)
MTTSGCNPAGNATAPTPAATVIVLREGATGVEVFCVERNRKSSWLGGFLVFPGGKVDASDGADARALGLDRPQAPYPDPQHAAFRWAAARELLEEAALFPGELTHTALLTMRERCRAGASLRVLLEESGVTPEMSQLVPFARWITPVSETRRFDTHFFLTVLRTAQVGAHDDNETVRSFWQSPRAILRSFEAKQLLLAPPTHRSLEVLAEATSVEGALREAAASATTALPICPELHPHYDSRGETKALTLPGDPQHAVQCARVRGHSRFVLRGTQWLPEPAPEAR